MPLKLPPPPETVTITRLGADGDGLAALPDGTALFVAAALPGERVCARATAPVAGGWAAEPDAVEVPSPHRVPPPCPLFPACGGCALQHADDALVVAWKRDQFAAALRRAGFAEAAPEVAPTTPPFARRRVDLALLREGGTVLVGLHRRREAAVVDLVECHVLHPALFAVLAPLRAALPTLRCFRSRGAAVLNLLDEGADLLLRTEAPPDSGDRTRLAALAAATGMPRVAWAPLAPGPAVPEVVVQRAPAAVTLSGVAVPVPPGAFLQASREGEAAIVAAVLDALPSKRPARARAVELYAGCGTLSLPLSRHARVQCFEADAAACAALHAAAPGIAVTRRDLHRQPLAARELNGAALVVLDPPWAGAAAQMSELARCDVPRIAYVSCNPQALARDAAVLAAAGWRLLRCTVVDQFRWSARVEGVAVFGRK